MREIIGEKTKEVFKYELEGKLMKIFPIGTPKSTHFKNVRSEFTQEEWDKVRRKSYKEAGYMCEVCGQNGIDQGYGHPIECHEIWDFDIEDKTQTLIGLISLCPRCHKIIHWTLTGMMVQEDQISHEEFRNIKRHFLDVNELKSSTVDDAIYKNLNFHKRKHKIDWIINIDYAFEYIGLNKNRKKQVMIEW